MRRILFLWLLFCGSYANAAGKMRTNSSGGGGFLEFHVSNLSKFDSSISGNPMIIGGVGTTPISSSVQAGGAGGASFVLSGSQNVQFTMGYGGILGEYHFASSFFFRLLVGGGGYAVVQLTSDTETEVVGRKVSSGGFVLFHPTLHYELDLTRTSSLSVSVGYFLPNVANLAGFTLTLAFKLS